MNRRKLVSKSISLLFSIPKGECSYKPKCLRYERIKYLEDATKTIYSKPCLDKLDATNRWVYCFVYQIFFTNDIVQDARGKLLVEYAVNTVLSLLAQKCLNSNCSTYGKKEYEKNGEKGNLCNDLLGVEERWSCEPYKNFLSKEIEKAEKAFRKISEQKEPIPMEAYLSETNQL